MEWYIASRFMLACAVVFLPLFVAACVIACGIAFLTVLLYRIGAKRNAVISHGVSIKTFLF